mmetsp:Transcript_7643/g.15973  ORF Transcript_7643/g.15973 Transcript_7643/m.15973 type:complete len:215 (-) Transcript_7643:556-1200(-)
MNFQAPILELLLQEGHHVIWLCCARVAADEGIPLSPTATDITSNEEAAGSDVDLVADLEIVLCGKEAIACEAGVPAVGDAAVGPLHLLFPHLRSDPRPYAVGTDEDVTFELLAILANGLYTVVGHVLVAHHPTVVLDVHVGVLERLEKRRLQTIPRHHPAVGQVVLLRHRADRRELGVPFRTEAVLHATGAGANDDEVLHNPLEERGVHSVEGR